MTTYNNIFNRVIVMLSQNAPEKKSIIQLLVEKNPCTPCRAMKNPICRGHGGGGGGGGSSGSERSAETTRLNALQNGMNPAELISLMDALTAQAKAEFASDYLVQYEAGLVLLESNKLLGLLMLRPRPGLSRAELDIWDAYIAEVKKAFNDFKQELAEKGHSVDHLTLDETEHGVEIRIPDPKQYLNFIEQLVKRNLLPIPDLINKLVNENLFHADMNPHKQAEASSYKTPRLIKT